MTSIERRTAERNFYLVSLGLTTGERLTLRRLYYLKSLSKLEGNGDSLEMEWLASHPGVIFGERLSMWKKFLNLEGYTGEVETMRTQFYIDNS